jgi:K+-sensing histidine kinase KdpD
MILVCVTDQQSCDRLIYAGYRLAQKMNESMEVITVRPRNMGKCSCEGNCWLGSPELEYLSHISNTLDVELSFIFHDVPADAIADYIRKNDISILIAGVASTGGESPFLKGVSEQIPDLIIFQVNEKGKIIESDRDLQKERIG